MYYKGLPIIPRDLKNEGVIAFSLPSIQFIVTVISL